MKTDTKVSCELGKTWRVERQRPSECLLATLAALSGKPYWYVRSKAHHFLREWYAQETDSIPAECTWERFAIGHRDPYRYATECLTDLLGLQLISLSSSTPTGHDWTIPLHGQGYILFKHSGGSHIAPWRNGLIYDVGADDPMQGVTLSTYLTLNSFVVLTIRTTRMKEGTTNEL